ncbi:membrane protein insertion efficiency factor YidD, partial [Enterococcus durans]|nr:membrane protein insertion efficiency factor YidD [Enterococcus durans]
ALLRLLRCNQWNRGGIDDVPQLYSLFYRCSWSKAHEEPRLTPLNVEKPIGDKETGL